MLCQYEQVCYDKLVEIDETRGSAHLCGAFLMPENRDPEIVRCPYCGKRVAYYDGRTSVDIETVCRPCHLKVVYHVATGRRKISEYPVRNIASGTRIW